MRALTLSLLLLVLLSTWAFAQDDDVDSDVDVAVDVDMRDDEVVADNDLTDDGFDAEAEVTLDSSGDPVDADVEAEAVVDFNADDERTSLRDEYRQWSGRSTSRSRTRSSRSGGVDSTDDFDSTDDLGDAARDVDEWWNEDVVNTDRDNREDRINVRGTSRDRDWDGDDEALAADRRADRIYDDYDRDYERGSIDDARYWSRNRLGDRYSMNYYSHGCGCRVKDNCGNRCGVKSKCGSKCGTKCGCKDKCGSKCGSKCGTKSKCGSKCGKAKCGRKCGRC
jgi:hypothetical protein